MFIVINYKHYQVILSFTGLFLAGCSPAAPASASARYNKCKAYLGLFYICKQLLGLKKKSVNLFQDETQIKIKKIR